MYSFQEQINEVQYECGGGPSIPKPAPPPPPPPPVPDAGLDDRKKNKDLARRGNRGGLPGLLGDTPGTGTVG